MEQNRILHNLFLELKEVSERILTLSPDDETFEEHLAALQHQQHTIRNKAAQMMRDYKLAADPQLVSECLQMERQIRDKLIQHKTEVEKQIQKIQDSWKMKNAYQRIIQTEGMFFDRHN